MDSHDDSEINDYERVKDPADPRRCQGLILSGKQQGQCLMVAMVGTSYCKVHHGPSHVAQQKKKDNRLYNLGKYQARLERQADHDQIKSLREEIGILRIMIEERIIASSGSQVDLCIASGPISDMVMKVEKLVTSCNRSESQMGMLLDAAKAVQLAQEIVEAVADEIDDPDKLNRIADAVSAAVSRATTKAG